MAVLRPAPEILSELLSRTRAHRRAELGELIRRVGARLGSMIDEERRFGHGFLWIPVFMGAGAAFALDRTRDIALAAILGPLAAAVIFCILARGKMPRWSAPAVLAAAFLAGMAASALEMDRRGTTLLDGDVVTHVTGTVVDRQMDEKGHWRYTIELASTADPTIGRPPEIVRLLARSRHEPIGLGGGITGLARISPPSGPALPGGYDFAFSAFFQGIGAIGFFYGAPSAAEVGSQTPETIVTSLRRWVARIRAEISTRIRNVLDGQEGALAAALIVADVGGLSDDTLTALRNSGLAHIISISGLHMALVAGTLFVSLRTLLCLFPGLVQSFPVKKAAAAGALVVSTIYLVLSGASVPTERSWIMLAIVLLAVMIDRPAFTLRNVALAAIAIITVTPSSIVGPSFQMSFAATAALVSGYGALARWRSRRDQAISPPLWKSALLFVAGVAFTSVIAGGATGLFAAYHFHRLTSLGVLGNLLATPVVSFVVMPMALVAVLLMPYGLEAWPLKVMGFGLDVVIEIAHRVAALGGIVTTGRLPLIAAMAMGVGFLILVLMRSQLRFAGIGFALAGLLMMLPPFAPARPDILISEDGRLVGINMAAGLATNRERPSAFIFDQWLSAMKQTRKVTPAIVDTGIEEESRRKDSNEERPDRAPASKALIDKMASRLPSARDRFACFGKVWCGARFKDVSVITVSDAAYLGAACDLADIVVTPVAVRMDRCRSGALLFTATSLRRSGATEIYVLPKAGDETGDQQILRAPSGVKHGDDAASGFAGRLRVVSALAGVIRPWTVQRYYDWRTRSFDFGEETAETPNDTVG